MRWSLDHVVVAARVTPEGLIGCLGVAVVFAAAPEAAFIVGQDLVVEGGASA
jgi:hypothetical protein